MVAVAPRRKVFLFTLGPEAVGHPIELRLLRAGKLLSLTATVAARPSG